MNKKNDKKTKPRGHTYAYTRDFLPFGQMSHFLLTKFDSDGGGL